MDVATILNLIDVGEYGLPEFQRGYVWSREQVRHFMSSLYHENPVGSLLIWTTNTDADVRGEVESPAGNIKLIVDGQQRITTLYGIRRGKAPPFFRGNPNSFLNLYFNLDGAKGEEFEFYGPVKMKDNPRWVSVTRVLQEGAVKVFLESGQHDELALAKLNRLEAVQKKMFHIETITGKDLDEVVDIFNMVNSGGTKLNAADLAMAKLSARWPAARDEMEARLHKWNAVGYGFDFNWLLRGVTINVTGDARFSTLSKVDPAAFEHGLRRFEKHNNELLLQIRANLGLDHGKVLRSEFSLLVLARYLELHNGLRQGEAEVAHILYWYVHTMLWGRYSASTESRLNQDLGNLRETEFADAQIAGLAGALRSERGTLRLQELDFHGSWVGNRFYPLLYLLTRVARARDLLKNIPLSMSLIGNPLELHHLFPKTHLYKAGRNRRDVNTLANFAFLTSESNRSIGSTLPRDYFTDCERRYPGVLKSQWIPEDPALWELDNYDAFLDKRRKLLVGAANVLLDSLRNGKLPQLVQVQATTPEAALAGRPSHIASDEEERALQECQLWMESHGLPRGETGYELVDEASGELLAILDLAWTDGVQPGLGKPVALLIDEDDETRYAAQQKDFRYFTNVSEFKQFVGQTALAE